MHRCTFFLSIPKETVPRPTATENAVDDETVARKDLLLLLRIVVIRGIVENNNSFDLVLFVSFQSELFAIKVF